MEYMQMTIEDWLNAKETLRKELQNVKQSFVRIGFYLRRIDDSKGYQQGGYSSLSEFAKTEYGLEASTVSRFMSINKEFSMDGYSERLDPKYLDFKRSQLEEMLKLPEEDREMIAPETPRQEIRDLKKFNKEEPKAEEADNLTEVIKKFYEDNPKILNDVLLAFEDAAEVTQVAEIVNPSGNKSYRKGIFFLMMYKDKIVLKRFGSKPEELTWATFFDKTKEIYPEQQGNGWQQYLEKEGPDPVPEEKNEIKEEPKDKEKMEDKTASEETETETEKSQDSPERLNGTEIAPAQMEEEKEEIPEEKEEIPEEKEEENIPEEEKTVPKTSENVPKEEESVQKPEQIMEEVIPEKDDPEVLDKFSTRKEYLDGCTEWGAALYISRAIKSGELTPDLMINPESLETWLCEEVNTRGESETEEEKL